MQLLYPDIHPYKEHRLSVSDGHQIYLEESGNPQGIPVLFVHGGPGGGTTAKHRSYFNPEKYRIILFDQRGCGRSTPHARLEGNNSASLIEDMEQIRELLNVEQWLLFGGSWGSTLSLLYAQAHPTRVSQMILRGIFLARQQDIDWLVQQGASKIFPDHWQDFIAPIEPELRADMLNSYYSALTSKDELKRLAAARAWSLWEGRCSTLEPSPDVVEHYTDPHLALSMARLEAHYFVNHCFIEENQILQQAERISHIPTTIVHGRYDMVCPAEQAYSLYQALPNSELHWVRNAGHSGFEPGIVDNLVRATDNFARSLA